MGAAPRFSVVMPVYNVGAYLDESVGSVLAQTCSDYEVVLVDDGSTDGSGEKCDAYAAAHDNFTVVHQENCGLLLARRAGFSCARGEYVVSLDSDDCLRADALERVSCVIDDGRPDVVTFAYSRSGDFSLYRPSLLDVEEGLHDESEVELLRRIVAGGHHVNIWSKVFRRSLIDTSRDYSQYRGMTHAEDLFQIVPMVDGARSFAYCAEPLYFYRPNPLSSTRYYVPRQLDDLCVALDELMRYATLWGDECLRLAHESTLLQCSYLLHILFMDSEASGLWREEFLRLRACAEDAGFFGPWNRGIRADRRLETWAMEHGRFLTALRKQAERHKRHSKDQ